MRGRIVIRGPDGAAMRNSELKWGNYRYGLFLLCTIASLAYAADPPAKEAPPVTTTGEVQTARTWVSYVGMGAQFLPDYNDQGKSEGFKKQQFFADLFVDGRFTDDCKSPGDTADKKNYSPANVCGFASLHTGVRLTLLGAPVARQDNTGIAPTKFSDVSQALIFAPYAYWSVLQGVERAPSKSEGEKDFAKQYVHNLGPLIRGGLISRDSVDTSNGDTASWFAQLGLQYTYESYRFNKISGESVTNGLPEGFASVTWGRFEDYANLGKRNRLIVEAGYRVLTKTRLYLGFKANLGKGPDDFGAFLAYYFSPDKLVGIFGTDDK